MTTLAPYITAAYRRGAGYPADPAYHDFLAAFADNPMLVEEARTELARLADRGGQRVLVEHDHESKIRHATLTRMLAQFDAERTA